MTFHDPHLNFRALVWELVHEVEVNTGQVFVK